MVIDSKNKGSHFCMQINPQTIGYMNSEILTKIENEIDIILAQITATANIYKFENKEKSKIIYLFSTATRKRKGQLNKLIEKKLLEKKLINNYKIIGLLKKEFYGLLQTLKEKHSMELSSEPTNFEGYTGKDLMLFKNKNNWYQWQSEVYDMLFEKDGRIKVPDSRSIISIYDEKGCTGKSTFFKYLYFKHPDKIARISYGTAQQLRSSLVNLSSYEIYIIDLVRTKSRYDSYIEIISVIEDLKNGLVFNAMYGTGNTLMMEPPHIIMSSNFVPNVDLLSKDRWKVYKIKNQKLIDITNQELRKKRNEQTTKK